MKPENPDLALEVMLEAESGLLLTGNIEAVLGGLESKRALIAQVEAQQVDNPARTALRAAARRQQQLLRATLAGINTARSHLMAAANPPPLSSYTRNGTIRELSSGPGTTLKTL